MEAFAGVSCVPCFAEIEATAHVLDLGCGAGLDTLLVAEQAGSVLGVDFSEAMLSRAETSARSMGLDNVEFRQGSAEAIPCETGSIDVALVNGLFNLNPARTEIFRELARVVHPGGLVFAAELILNQPLAEEARRGEIDWFARISGAKEGGSFLDEFRGAGFSGIEMLGRHSNPRSSNPHVEVAQVRARR